MKAAVLNEVGGPEKLQVQDVPNPEPKGNDVLVRLHFAALNRVDLWLRAGSAAYPLTAGHIPGCDGSGVVEAVGPSAEGVSPGDTVLIFPALSCGKCAACVAGMDNQCASFEIFGTRRPGTCAQMTLVPDTNLIPVPEGVPLDEAAAFPLTYLTVWHMLFGRGGLKSGETAYVVGGSSGIGAAAIQLAKWKGARVLASTTAADKTTKIKRLGAADVLLADNTTDVAAWVLEKTGGKGADLVVEHVGPATWEASLKSVARGGRLITCGATSGASVNLELRQLFSRDVSIHGARMGTAREFQDLCRVMLGGSLHPVIDRTFPLDSIADAHRHMEAGKHMGKILIDVR